jgi:transcription termination/antitermination protein NusA
MAGSPEVVRLIDSIARDKDIDKEVLFESLEVAMIAAARKKYDQAIELDINIDRESGEIVGVQDGVSIDTGTLGRIAAQTAKHVMMQKIREAEQDVIFEEFVGKKGSLITGTIQRFEGENIIIDINKAEAIMPRHERVRTETYHVSDRVRCVIADVKKVGHRVRIVLSRTHPDLVRRLFELEIPEIAEHVIEIKAVAREPGFRTKLAVVSYDTKVDCVGACVGIRGSRIRNIIDELNGEKIDIIRWNDSPEILIMNALKPAEIQSITLDDATKEAAVSVAEDQLSLAIGKRGQNVRLAARLTGWDVNIVGAGGQAAAQSDAQKASNLSEAEKRLLQELRGSAPGAPAAAADEDPLVKAARQALSAPPSSAALAAGRALFKDDIPAPAAPAPAATEVAAPPDAAEEQTTSASGDSGDEPEAQSSAGDEPVHP